MADATLVHRVFFLSITLSGISNTKSSGIPYYYVVSAPGSSYGLRHTSLFPVTWSVRSDFALPKRVCYSAMNSAAVNKQQPVKEREMLYRLIVRSAYFKLN